MENTATMPAAMPATQAVEALKVSKKEHWFVEVVGGFTIAATMFSGLSLFYVSLVYATLA